MIIYKKRRALVLRHRDPQRLLTLIPTAKLLTYKGKQLVVVPHRVDEVKVLRNEGIAVPSPIHYYYDWPGQFKPFEAQAETAAFLTLHSKAFNLSDIGTGKSLGTLWAYDYLRSQGKVNKALVIAPLSTLERTWADEVFMHFPHLTAVVLHGSKERRVKLLKQEADIYIINHDGLKILQDEFKQRPDINHVIIDEISQCARNHTTHRWKALNEVVNKQCPRTAWGLTGTPTPNSPTDAWAQCKLLVPSSVDKYFLRFKMQVMRQISTYLWLPRENATEVVFNAMQPAIRYSRDECVDLPPLMYETRVVRLSKEQQLAYKDMLDNLHTELSGGEITAVNEGVKLSKLLQIVCGVAYDGDRNEVTLDASHRLAETLSIVEEASTKVIIYVPFVSSIKLVTEHLRSHGQQVESVHGGTSKSERDRIFRAFQKDAEPRVLVAQPAAMSHGLTLTAASTILWYAPITSNDIFEQANGRITRPSQKNNQFIIMLEGAPVERKIYDRLRNKQKVQGVLLSMIQTNR